MFFIEWIKNFGVGHAIDALDNLEIPLGNEIEKQKQKIQSMNSRQMAVWIVDQVQSWLRKYFKIDPPLPPENV